MSFHIIFFILILLYFHIDATHINYNDTVSEEHRQPRVNGRIVKLYSGTRPEPFLCPSEGFQADPVDCAVFYRCVRSSSKYTVFRFQCGPGTVYDPDTEVCNHPQNTKRSECGGRVSSSTEQGHENEIDGAYGAQSEVPSPISTKKPVYTDQTTLSTAYPWATSSQHHNSKSPIASSSIAGAWMTTVASQSLTPSKASTRRPSSQDGDTCTSDGFMGDSENCRKFYRCVGNQRGGYIKYEFSCSESTIWDEDTQSCNHPWAVQRRRCGRGNNDANVKPSSPEQLSNEVTKQEQLQISYGSKVSQTQTQISHELVKQNQTQINRGDHANKKENLGAKQNQTQISHGSAISQSQTQIQHGNKGIQTQLQLDHTKQSSQTQTQLYETSSKSSITVTQHDEIDESYVSQSNIKEEGSKDEDNNDNECTGSGFMGDKDDCKFFYRCVDNGRGGYTKYEFSCGEGTVWDSNIEACNHVWAVKECGGKVPVQSSSQSETTTMTSTKTTKASTQYYYTTLEPITEEQADISYGNQNQQSTSTISDVQIQPITTSSNSEGTKCTSSGFVGDTNDCKKFYRCVDNGKGSFTEYEYKCGDGTVWDPDINACNHAWAVKQCGGSSSDVDIHNVEITTSTEKSIMTTVFLVQTTTQTSNQNGNYDPGYGQQQSETSTTASTSTTSQHHTEGQNERNECKTSGFMGDKNDCKIFYRCVDNGNGSYTRYEFSCGEGTVWDRKIEACNHAWAVEKCGSDNSGDIQKETTSKPNPTISVEETSTDNTTTNEKETTNSSESSQFSSTTTSSTVPNESSACQTSGFMGDKNDCKKFYRCVDNGRDGFIRYEFSCGEGTVWDQSIEGCNHAWAVKTCSNEAEKNSTHTQVTTTTQGSSATIVQSEGNGSSSSEMTTTTTSEFNNGSTDNVCITDGFIGDSEDCKKFYRCVDNGRGEFIKYEFSCGEGTVWDPQIDACNHPKPNQKCGEKENKPSATEQIHENDEIYTDSTNKPFTSISSSQENVSSETTQKPLASADETCKSEGFYGDSNDCKKFYRCVDNGKGSFTKYYFKCGDGTVWDQEIQGCNHESSNKRCSKSTTPPQTQSESTEKYTSTTSSNPEDQEPSIPDQTKAPSNSNDQCSSEGFFANSNDCKKFYRCVSNGKGEFTKYDFACGEGTVWVQDIQACDHDDGVCTNQISVTETTAEINELTTSASATSSEISTQSQNPNKDNDEYPNESSGGISAASHEECNNEGFYGNKNDCTRFYRCVDNGNGGYTKYEFTCGEGTAWDSDIQNCNHIGEVKSCQNLNQDGNQQSKPIMQDEETSQTTDNPSTSKGTTITSSSTTENSKPANKDTCDQEGYFGNTKDCKQFYRCVDNGKGGFTKHDFTCGEGTIWDQDITTCNHPQDVTNPSCKQTDGDSSSTSSSESPASSSSSSTSQSSSSTTESSNQGSSNCSQEDSTKKPGNQNITCSKAGYYANPNDCKKFYRCVDWDGDGKRFSVYHFDCGEGTIWDPALETCNHEDSVYPPRDCSGTQTQTENVNQESTTTGESTTSQENTDTTQELTTTQSSTTEDQTTTQQSTTSEQTTTQQTTTNEQTTSQPTTTEETTTSEQTTAQQTTSEQTTTEHTTTSEEITTQQTSTSEQTTTQQTTTNDQTTTQQSTTSEQTTTIETTTNEQTTTQQTTAQSTTTEETTTSEQSTTQQTTTSEHESTTEQSTTEKSTTEQSTTEQTTTHKSDEETTTHQSPTTEESTTTEKSEEESTTEQSTEETTHASTTEQQTTESGSTTQQTDDSSTTEGEQESTTESSSSSDKDCPETDDDQNLFVCPTSFRRHPKYCNLFYQCNEDDDNHDIKIAVFNCPNNTIYDESQTKCVEENKAEKKCNGEIAQKRRVKRLDTTYKEPIVVSKASLKCPAAGYIPFENEECSSAFLKCSIAKSGKLRGFIYQCPEGYVYWSVSRRCEKKSSVRFCKQSYNNWHGRWEIPIERRNVAP